jgi:hypothetical protein
MPSSSPTSVATSLCGDVNPRELVSTACTNVTSWVEFVSVVERAEGYLALCPFYLNKTDLAAAKINKDLVLVCPFGKDDEAKTRCTIDGPGSHLRITGNTRVIVSGFVFTGANTTAVRVETNSVTAETSFCWNNFMMNKRTSGDGGGSLTAYSGSGVVNVVSSGFWYGEATVGAAIWSTSYKLTVIGATFVANTAYDTASAIFSNWNSHLLLRDCSFVLNVAAVDNYDVVLNHVNATNVVKGVFADAGGNQNINSGLCQGVYNSKSSACQVFDSIPALPTAVYPYVPGDLSVYDEETGIALSTGLRIRELARTGEYVLFGSKETRLDRSSIRFHDAPDGAAVVANGDEWLYVSNCESKDGNGKGGVFVLKFDQDGEIKGYEPRLLDTTRNCNGGLTPWKTWVSCEEYGKGQCWQVDPFGVHEPEPTVIGEPEGGSFEAFVSFVRNCLVLVDILLSHLVPSILRIAQTYDDRDADQLVFFVTEDHARGALRRFRTNNVDPSNLWDSLHGTGTRDYLKLDPAAGTFEWTSSLDEGRRNAEQYFPHTEGISHMNGILYFVSKKTRILYILNLDAMTYTTSNVNSGKLLGRGNFGEEADHVVQLTDNTVYFTEDGGRTPGVYGKDVKTGQYFAIMEAVHSQYKNDEATGLAFSPDWTRMYVCIQDNGVLFEIRRKDGMPFESAHQQLRLKYHRDGDT